MFEFFLKGGPLMWPILLCSITSIAIVLERFYFFHRIKPKIPNLFSRIRNFLRQNKFDEALRLCETTPGPIPHILAVGIRIRKRPFEERERIIAQATSKLVRSLEKNFNILAIIGNVSPLLGLLGTVAGMIKAFMKIQELSGRVDVSMLAGGIWEALITTAAGLSVAIPTIIFYHYFESKADNVLSDIKETATELLEMEDVTVESKESEIPWTLEVEKR